MLWETIKDLLLPAVIGVAGWWIQRAIARQQVQRDYVELSTRILASEGKDQDLRRWAVDLLKEFSPVAIPETAATRLVAGQVSLPGRQFLIAGRDLQVSQSLGFIDAAGVLLHQVPFFPLERVRSLRVALQLILTNRSTEVPIGGISVKDELGLWDKAILCEGIREGYPTRGRISNLSSSGFDWELGTLAPGESAEIQFHIRPVKEGREINRVKVIAAGLEDLVRDLEIRIQP